MITALLGEFWPWIIGALGVIGGIFAIRRDAKQDVRRQTALDAAEAQAKTRERIDHANDGVDSDPGALREWLRIRGDK